MNTLDFGTLDESSRNALRELLAKKDRCSNQMAAELEWDMTQPCSDCPFRKSSPFHGGVATNIPSYVDTIEGGIFAHTCHKTDTSPQCDGPVRGMEAERPAKHCAGAILMLLKTGDGKDLQLPLLKAAEAGKIDVHRMAEVAKDSPDVFTLREFLVFYVREIAKRAGVECDL